MQILLDTKKLSCSSTGRVTGSMYVLSHGVYFPEEKWLDWPASNLLAWIVTVEKICKARRKRGKLTFVEGADYLRLTKVADVKVKIEGVCPSRPIFGRVGKSKAVTILGRTKEVIAFSETISLVALQKMLNGLAIKLLRVCKLKDWQSYQVSALRQVVELRK